MGSEGWLSRLVHRASRKALKKLEHDDNFQFLHQHKLFQELSPTAFHFLYGRLNERRYQRDELVFKEGNPGICLFIVKQGRVEIFGEDAAEGPETVYTQVGPGAVLGELSILSNPYRNSSARATEHGTVLLTLSAYDLDDLCQMYPQDGVMMIRALNRTLVDHLTEVDRQLQETRRELQALKQRLGKHE